jgi:hypothetical protein
MFTTILMAIFPDVLKKFIGGLSATAIKYIVIVIAVASFGGAIWYWTDVNAQKELENIRLVEANKRFAETEKSLHLAIEAQSKAFIKQQKEFNLAVSKQSELQDKIAQLAGDRKDEQSVFTKKKDRYERLLQDNGNRIINLSNIASKRVRLKWVRETNKINNSLQERSRNLFASPKNETVEPE